MTGDRLPAFFLKGVWQGLKIALIPHARLRDPLGPMPTVRDWLDMYGGTRMDADMFDRCESEWYALLEQRKRRMSAFLAGGYAGTWMYAIVLLHLVFGTYAVGLLVIPSVVVIIEALLAALDFLFEFLAGDVTYEQAGIEPPEGTFSKKF